MRFEQGKEVIVWIQPSSWECSTFLRVNITLHFWELTFLSGELGVHMSPVCPQYCVSACWWISPQKSRMCPYLLLLCFCGPLTGYNPLGGSHWFLWSLECREQSAYLGIYLPPLPFSCFSWSNSDLFARICLLLVHLTWFLPPHLAQPIFQWWLLSLLHLKTNNSFFVRPSFAPTQKLAKNMGFLWEVVWLAQSGGASALRQLWVLYQLGQILNLFETISSLWNGDNISIVK